MIYGYIRVSSDKQLKTNALKSINFAIANK